MDKPYLSEADFANSRMTEADILAEIIYYEQLLGMSRSEFRAMCERGEMPDTYEAQDFRGLLRLYDHDEAQT